MERVGGVVGRRGVGVGDVVDALRDRGAVVQVDGVGVVAAGFCGIAGAGEGLYRPDGGAREEVGEGKGSGGAGESGEEDSLKLHDGVCWAREKPRKRLVLNGRVPRDEVLLGCLDGKREVSGMAGRCVFIAVGSCRGIQLSMQQACAKDAENC